MMRRHTVISLIRKIKTRHLWTQMQRTNTKTCASIIVTQTTNTNGRIAFEILKVTITVDIWEKMTKSIKKRITRQVTSEVQQGHQRIIPIPARLIYFIRKQWYQLQHELHREQLFEGEDTKPIKAILSTEVLLGTQVDNRTFQTLIDTGLSISLMSNKAALFQRALGDIFLDIQNELFYLYDILIVLHRPFKKHLHIIDQVFHHLHNKNMTSNAKKSEWAKNTVHFWASSFWTMEDAPKKQKSNF